MPISNPLSNLFGKSPIKPIQEHMEVAHQAVQLLTPFFDAVTKNDWQAAGKVQKDIGELENKGDTLKREIRRHLPKSLFLPVPRSDLLELLSMQDSIANRAKDIAGIMLGREMSLPTAIEADMLKFVETCIATSAQALTAINELDELLETGFAGRELQIVENLIQELDNLESLTDDLEVTVRSTLFKIEKELPPVDVIFLYRVIEWVGDVADRAQKVGSRLQLLLAR
ncbi:TIGR00153 family protein [Pseudomaricurvus sp. HS19]|uniref:TIGR00153 family protein n=1 Tax=Pseudomaricurvus sp. HS19 TaxID=2692626 RepID=UPI0013696DF2|nr:TIGR00153 family protein [Pseudomaricurvus sp. HS19]MYM63400.1 TIGR00153 family protein [Pseudomaricurvus sp. HS19]